MSDVRKRIAVVGAGISGLVCAYELQKAGFEVRVFEKNDYVGGRMGSRDRDGLIFDIGADHLTNNYREMRRYCQEFDIPWQKVAFLKYRIFRDGELKTTEGVLSRSSKWRMALQWMRAPKGLDYFNLSDSAHYDTEVGYDYIRRKAGQEVADYLFNAYCAAYQFHLADEVSKAAVMDTLCSLKYESKGWHLHHMKGGMRMLPEALAERLSVSLQTAVEKVSVKNSPMLEVHDEVLSFDAVVLATTADVAKKIFADASTEQLKLFDAVCYAASISVCFRVDTELLQGKPSTVWVPFVENGKVAAYVNETYKGTDCIEDGKTLVTVWLHQGWAEELMGQSDEALFSAVKKEYLKVCPWFDQESQLENWDLQRWPQAEPKFYQGYVRLVADFLAQHQGHNGVWLCGDYLNAPWAEGALRCGQRVAQQVQQSFGEV